ncbi:MAG: MBL fold metallo-hydrolase [Poseidonia sp.]
MGFDVHVLGTASARPTAERAVSGSLVKGPEGIVVVDAGEGFQSRFTDQRRRLKAHSKGDALKPTNVRVLAFTHGHLDHTWGALPWLQSMDLENRQTPLLVMGPTSMTAIEALRNGEPFPDEVPPADLARQFVSWFMLGGAGLTFPIRWVLGDVHANVWVELDPRENTVTELEGMPQPEGWKRTRVTPYPTQHTVPSCGWMVSHGPSLGTFDRARADELNLSTKQRAQLARGEDIELTNGDTLESAWFRGEDRPPLSVLISGDTASCPPKWPAGLNPTLLIHEATFLNEQQDKAHEHQHSTAVGAVQTAKAVSATYLALTHYSNRIKDVSDVLDEALPVAGELPVVALNDADRLRINDEGLLNHLAWGPAGWKARSIPPIH